MSGIQMEEGMGGMNPRTEKELPSRRMTHCLLESGEVDRPLRNNFANWILEQLSVDFDMVWTFAMSNSDSL